MNFIDEMTLRAIRRQTKTGNRAIDGFVEELRGMGLWQLARLYVKGDRGLKRFVAAEAIQRLVHARGIRR